MLFSDDSVASFVNANFEPAWESVRSVPLVHIDFGNGRVLTRTLHGNILTSVCTAEGLVLDALPGLYAPAAYQQALDQLRLLARYLQARPAAQRSGWLRAYHRRQADALARGQTPEQFSVGLRTLAITKSVIERPLEVVLGPPPPSAPNAVPSPPKEDTPRRLAGEDVGTWKALAEDTRLNERTRRQQVHELLAGTGPVRPEKVTRPIYRDVLHADLDDPYLGLGRALFGTYPFAREDRVR